MSDLENIKTIGTAKKRLHSAKAEMYPLIQILIDTSLEVRGISMATAMKHECSEKELWEWIISQIVD